MGKILDKYAVNVWPYLDGYAGEIVDVRTGLQVRTIGVWQTQKGANAYGQWLLKPLKGKIYA